MIIATVLTATSLMLAPTNDPKEAMATSSPVSWQAFTLEGPEGAKTDGELGTIMVPENRRKVGSRHIPLKFLRLPSVGEARGHPIVYLAGGPGGSAIRNGEGSRFEFFQNLRAVGDVILLEQRGTGHSNTIPECKVQIADLARPLDRDNFVESYRREFLRCASYWKGQGVDVEGYNTEESAADLEALRTALGAQKLNLVGLSYGTHLGMAALKQNLPVDRVVFAGLEGLDQTVKLPAAFDAFFARVGQAVRQSAEASAAYPDLVGMMRRVHARLDREPAVVVVPGMNGASDRTIRLGSFGVQLLAGFTLISDPGRIAGLPEFYARMDRGDYSVTAAYLLEGLDGDFSTFSGMPQLMDLASGISHGRLAIVEKQSKTAVLGDAGNYPMPHVLDADPQITLTGAFRKPLSTNVPALLIMSTMDGRTPVESQEELLPQFKNATRINVINGGHNIWEQSEAVRDAVVEFLKGGTVSTSEVRLPATEFILPRHKS